MKVIISLFLGLVSTLHALGQQPIERFIISNQLSVMQIDSMNKAAQKQIDNNTDSSLMLSFSLYRLSLLKKYNRGVADALLNIATCYGVNSQPEKARQYLMESEKFCVNDHDKYYQLARWHRVQALLHKFTGQTDSAFLSLRQANHCLQRVDNNSLKINIYNLFGSLLVDVKNYDEALFYIKKAMALNNEDNSDKIVSLLNSCYVFFHKNDTANLLKTATKAQSLSSELNYPQYERSASIILTGCYLWLKNYKQANKYANRTVDLVDKSNSDNALNVYRKLTDFYTDAGLYTQALQYSKIALSYYSSVNLKRLDAVDLYRKMSYLYGALDKNDSAYFFLLMYHELMDSLDFVSRSALVTKLEKQYKLSEKENEITQKEFLLLQQKSKIRSRNFWVMGTILGLVGMGVFLILYHRNTKKKLFILSQQREIDELRATLKGEEKERNRMAKELHDGVGGLLSAATLNLKNISMGDMPLVTKDTIGRVHNLLGEISREVRKSAHNLMPDVLLKSSLPDAIKHYCSAIKKNAGLQITVHTNDTFEHLDQELRLSIYRIVQELVQNILKHAQATMALVQVLRSGKLITITVEDNGIGFEKKGSNEGIGLRSIEERVAAFHGLISVNSSQENGTSIYIEFDLSLSNNKKP